MTESTKNGTISKAEIVARNYLLQRDRLAAELEAAKRMGDTDDIRELTKKLRASDKYITANRLERFRR
ncbi:hypothetical protein KXS15_09515 [Sinorhizobium meliloti]|uniref:hypothetical protein n=1 Tax=Rhizobium meliloti TaxID=382 RepID=UPI003F17345E